MVGSGMMNSSVIPTGNRRHPPNKKKRSWKFTRQIAMTLLTVFRRLASRNKTEMSLLGEIAKNSSTFFTSHMRQALPINIYLGTRPNLQ